MNYPETLDYLFDALPMFQRIGAAAFKKDLGNTKALCAHLGQSQHQFLSIHVAGTNGKGSSSHALASILQESGYKIGLYTSPHLKSFTERIKINGQEIPEQDVVEFVEENKGFLDELKPSFFEMTVGMAFWFFAKEKVDYAVIEVGMGGKYDSTNVIHPILSLITNIGMDHTQFLGNTLQSIAAEKAGIIKNGVPVIISERQSETSEVFIAKAKEVTAPIYFSEDEIQVHKLLVPQTSSHSHFDVIRKSESTIFEMDLNGNYQSKNLCGILKSVEVLQEYGIQITEENLRNGLINIVKNTGLKGRWQMLSEKPKVICDTGHNEDGIKYIVDQISQTSHNRLFMVFGMVADKDSSGILPLLPQNAYYFFCQANIPRAMDAYMLAKLAADFGLNGEVVPDVNSALSAAYKKANADDMIFVGGSTFVVSEINEL